MIDPAADGSTSTMTRIVQFGLGVMGLPMALTLLERGFEIAATDVDDGAVDAFAGRGGSAVDTDTEAVESADVVLTMLPEASHVRSVYEDLLGVVRPGTVMLDCSTIDVEATRQLAALMATRECPMVDAPVSGGPEGAAAGTLSFMVGGDETTIAGLSPVLDALGDRTTHFGPAGSGQAAKACHNMIVGITGLAVFEGFALAEGLGLDATAFHALCSTAAAACWTLENRCPVPGVVEHAPSTNGYTPGFAARLMAKDLALAQNAAVSAAVDTPFGLAAADAFRRFVEEGNGERDYSAYYETLSQKNETP